MNAIKDVKNTQSKSVSDTMNAFLKLLDNLAIDYQDDKGMTEIIQKLKPKIELQLNQTEKGQ